MRCDGPNVRAWSFVQWGAPDRLVCPTSAYDNPGVGHGVDVEEMEVGGVDRAEVFRANLRRLLKFEMAVAARSRRGDRRAIQVASPDVPSWDREGGPPHLGESWRR